MGARLDLAYEGTDFHGYARQPGVPTIQQVLEDALTTVIGSHSTKVAGRTDAGVHARHQVVSVAGGRPLPAERLARALRGFLPASIALWRVLDAPEGFDARFDASARTYRYRIDRSLVQSPFAARYAWHLPEPLDRSAMVAATPALVGTHDFASFCRRADGRTTLRTIHSALWWEDGADLWFEVSGPAFCHQQVRSLVGYLVEVGRGRADPDGTAAVLQARDRLAARAVAPPRGLTLWRVDYPPGFAEPPHLP